MANASLLTLRPRLDRRQQLDRRLLPRGGRRQSDRSPKSAAFGGPFVYERTGPGAPLFTPTGKR
jgi:hypothetical protein